MGHTTCISLTFLSSKLAMALQFGKVAHAPTFAVSADETATRARRVSFQTPKANVNDAPILCLTLPIIYCLN
jgi:hypothetical protein